MGRFLISVPQFPSFNMWIVPTTSSSCENEIGKFMQKSLTCVQHILGV